jgi:class 3 adenylate cyclase
MKRRPGIYNIYPISKKQEQKDSKKDVNKELEEKKEEEKIEQISPFLQKILDYESSFTGIILIIIIGTISLLLYDLKHAAIPGKYDIVSFIIMFLLSLYHVFDLIFRNIYLEKSVGSSYFKLQVFSVISLIFDFNLALFLLLRFIFNATINKKNKYLSSNNLQLIMYILNCLQVFKVLRFIKIYLMINKLFKEIEKKKKFEEVLEELKKKSQKGKILNMPLPGRLSQVKANINNNLTNNLNPNGNNGNNAPPAPKNDNGNVSYITTNSILNVQNRNEAENNKINNIIKHDNNNINALALPNINKTNNNIKDKDNASILPLNLNMTSPRKVNKKFLKSKSLAFKNKNEPPLDKDKTNKLMEKINEKFQQTRNATRLNNGISQLLIILLLLIFFMYTLTYGDFIYKREEEYKIISNYINILSNMCKQVYIQNDAHNSNFKCNELLSEKINALMNQISIKHFSVIQVEYNYEIIYRKTSLSNNTGDYYPGEYNYIYSKYDNLTSILILQNFYFRLYSILNLLKLLFILISLYIICLRLNKDLNLLILKPLNDINKVIDKVSKDPVNNKIISELKQNFENRIDNIIQRDQNNVKYEMKVIESTLIRTSGLISVGYGEAGSTIIKQFIKGNEGFDPMSSGNIIEAIFGFCFIHDFAEISEVFEEKTMIFVNHICDIVHSCVDKFNGYTNKNIGDCFLLAWKIKNSENKPPTKPISNKNIFNQNQNEELTELADCALLAFLNIFKKINKTRKILAYRKDPDIIKRFGTRYSIGLGFGLHYGWGIEGAIGSHHKIDCSYLSPNVNIAARLETATNIYGVDILFSGEFYELLSDFMKEKCRKIDVVTLKGSEKPVNLYTVDLNKNIKPGKLTSNKDRMSVREKMDYYGQKKRKLWKKYENSKKNKTIGEIYYKESKGFRQILNNQKSSLFYNNFEEGLSHYIDGEWEEAAAFLYRALYLDNSDGPTKTILEYMKKLKYKAPDDWDGYRVLTSKT